MQLAMEFDHFSCDELSSSDENDASHGASVVVAAGESVEVEAEPSSVATAEAGRAEAGTASTSPIASATADNDDELDDLYADIDTAPQLPSDLTLRRSLAAAISQRQELEAEIADLTRGLSLAKDKLHQSLRNASTILLTARHEIQRKESQVADARTQASARHKRKAGDAAAPPVPAREGGGISGRRTVGTGPVVDGGGSRKRAAYAGGDT